MIAKLRLLVLLVLVFEALGSEAQAPTISYSSPQTYNAGTAITPLTPTSSGVGAVGYSSATLTIASGFYSPQGLAIDAAGNVYIADPGNVNGITGSPKSYITMIAAGSTTQVSLGSGFDGPTGVAVDAKGNVYVADEQNNAVKMIPAGNTTGTTITLGSGFKDPAGVAVDAAGNIYVADWGNNAVKKMPAGGGTPVVIGSGFLSPIAVAVDVAGNVYVADYGNNSVKEIPGGNGTPIALGSGFTHPAAVAVDAAGDVFVGNGGATTTTVEEIPAGSSTPIAIGPQSIFPAGLAVAPSGIIYVSDDGYDVVDRIVPSGGYYAKGALPLGLTVNATTGAISGTPVASTPAENYTIIAYNAAGSANATVNIAIDPLISYPSPPVYSVGNTIVPLAPSGAGVTALAFSNTIKSATFTVGNPEGITFDRAGNLYVGDTGAGQIEEFPVGGGAAIVLYTGYPTSLVVDATGNIYTADQSLDKLVKIPAGGGTPVYAGAGQPRFVAEDGTGNIYYTDNDNDVVWEITAAGVNTQFASGFGNPAGIAVDAAGNVYIGINSNAIAKIPAGGGTPVTIATGFNFPEGMVFDAAGNLYIADAGNNAIKEIPFGSTIVSTLVTGLNNPYDVALDPAGNLYAADFDTDGLKEISPAGGYFLSPMLPAGLNFSSTTGVISGTPAAASPATNYTITGYNPVSSSSASVNVTVRLVPPATISYSSPQNFTLGNSVTPLMPTSSGVAVPGYNSSPLPIGNGFNKPYGIALDKSGNVYVADYGNNAIKEIPVGGGGILTLGSGFSTPTAVAVDAAGNVYVADEGNQAIKEIPAGGGAITTLATGINSFGLAVDAAGDVYAGDLTNQVLKKIPAGGGTPVTLTSGFAISGVVLDPAGDIYLDDYSNGVVKEILVGGGSIITILQGVEIIGLYGLAVDAVGNVFVNYPGTGTVDMIAAGSSSLTPIASGFSDPIGVVVDGYGRVDVADYNNDVVQQITPSGGYFLSSALPPGLSFSSATGAISGTPTAVSPATNYTVTAYNAGGPSAAIVNIDVTLFPLNYGGAQTFNTGVAITPITPVSSGVAAPGYGSTQTALGASIPGTPPGGSINGVASDPAGNLYEISLNNDELFKIPKNGTPSVLLSSLVDVLAVAADAKGNIYYTNRANSVGNLYEIPAGTTAPVNLSNVFSNPTAVAVDAAGDIYVADAGSNIVVELPASGGPGILMGVVNTPSAIAVDGPGNIYVMGIANNNSTIYEIPRGGGPATTVSTLSGMQGVAVDGGGDVFTTMGGNIYEIPPGGSAQLIASGDGNSNITGIFYAIGVATDGVGNVYAINNNNNPTLGEIKPAGGYFITPGLSAGLNFNNATGVINGTPVVASPATTYTITAYNSSGGSSTATVNITINLVNPTVTYSSPQTFQLGLPISPALAPASSAVSPPGYTNIPIVLGSIGDTGTLAVDAGDNVYTVGFINNSTICVCKIPSGGGTPVVLAATPSTGPYASSVTADASGNVYYTTNDAGSKSLGSLYRIAAGSTTSVLIASPFYNPYAMAVDSSGNVYVADYDNSGNGYVQEFPGGHAPGTKVISNVGNTNYLATDRVGNLYFYNFGEDDDPMICKLNRTTGVIDTITNSVNGQGLAVDGAGNIYTSQNDGMYEIPAGSSVAHLLAADNQLYVNGPGIEYSTSVAIDAAGNLFAINNANNHPTTGFRDIVKLTPTGGYFISPTIPAGVSFNYATGIISGTPTALSPATNYAVTAYNIYGGVTSQNINMQVVPSSAATLSMLAVSSGSLSPAFAAATTSYAVAVPYLTTSITVTATTSDVLAAVKVNGTVVTSGSASAAINLNVGANVINAVVTSEDGTTTKTYTLTVTRAAPSAVATLSNLKISSGTLSPAFTAATTSYTESLNYSISTVTITPTVTDNTASVTVNGTPVPSGSASATITLFVGINTITTVVTAQNGTTNTYTITVTREKSTNAALSNIVLSKGTLTPAFATATTSYTDMVTNGTTSLTVTPTLSNAQATVTVNGTAVASGKASGAIALSIGSNTITTVVTAQDGVTTKTYTVTVIRPSTNAKLVSLGISVGTLSPVFNANTTSYTSSETNTTTSVTVTPTVAAAGATIMVNGTPVVSGAPSSAIALSVGSNNISVVVTAQDGVTTDTYTITANRAASTNANLAGLTVSKGTLSPVFATATTSYTDMVTNGTTSITLTPTVADATATITVNGTTVVSGKASAAIALSVGSNNIAVAVTAQDGVTIKIYTINVIRPSTNSRLASLSLSSGTLAPVFSATTTSYTASVGNTISSVTLTPTVAVSGATIKVNGTVVNSGSPSAAIALNIGANTITTVVTAQDGVTTTTYSVIVTRAQVSSNDNLSALTISKGTLSPAFAAATMNYTDIVTNGTTSVTVTPTTADVGATVTVNGTTVASGKASGAIALVVGNNTATIIVTAQDGTTQKIYVVNVIRPSTNAKLSSLTISSGTLSPTFNTNTTAYTDAVTNVITSITLTPTIAAAGATIKVNGTTVASGTASGAIALAVGSNTITTVVTAQDGTTTDTYTITVTRAASGANIPDEAVSVNEPLEVARVVEDGIVVHQGVSPNGDGINDFLQIDNINNYPDNKLSIMNRNGQLVFEAKGYDNATKTFDGHSNKNGQMQLPGTYFYELDYKVGGEVKHKTGFLVLKY